MKIKGCKFICVAALLGLSATSMAGGGSWEAGVGIDFGGDVVIKVPYTTGEVDEIRAGEGLYIKVGRTFPLGLDGLELTGMVGWKYTSETGADGSVFLTRYPVDLEVRYTLFEKHRFGAGATTDLNIELDGSGVARDLNEELTSSVGYSLQYEYMFDENNGFGIRATSLEYEAKDYDLTFDAGSVGLVYNASF